MSIQMNPVDKAIFGLVKHFTSTECKKLFFSRQVGEKQAKKILQSEGIQPTDIDRFICEARNLGEAYTAIGIIGRVDVDEEELKEELVKGLQTINGHIKALEQDTLVGPKEEQLTGEKIEISVTVTKGDDLLKLCVSYAIKLTMWFDKLCALARRKIEEAKLP